MRSPLQMVRIEPRAHCCQRSNVNDLLVAIAYVMQKTPYVFPIVGARKVEHWPHVRMLHLAGIPRVARRRIPRGGEGFQLEEKLVNSYHMELST